MAYVPNQLTLIYTGGSSGQKWWSYITDDSEATIRAAGYFTDPSKLFQAGDILYVSIVDDVRNPTNGSASFVLRIDSVSIEGAPLILDFLTQPLISVLDYGADPSGTTDSTQAIQDGIDYLGTIGGGELLFPKGDYLCDGVEILNDNINLVGDGIGATKITYTNVSGTIGAFTFGQSKTGTGDLTPVSNCSIRKMEIDCQATDASGVVGTAVRSTVFDGFIVEEVYAHDCYGHYCFSIVGTGLTPRDGLIVKNCVARRGGADGLDIKAGAHRIIVDGFYTEGHLDQSGGDSVGLDIRGQYASVQNVFAENCIEIGIRIRTNAGIQQPASPDWTTTQDAKISMSNCFAYGCRDGFLVASPLDSSVSLNNCHALDNTRYGLVTADTADGKIYISNSSFNRGVRGASFSGEAYVNCSNCEFSFNSNDGVVFESASDGQYIFTNCHSEGNTRYGLYLLSTNSTTRVKLIGCTVNSNLTGVLTAAATVGRYEFTNTDIDSNTSRGIQINTSTVATVRFREGSVQNNATDVHAVGPATTFEDVLGVSSEFIGSTTVPVDSTGNRSFNFTHGLYTAPDLNKIQLSLGRDAAIEDFTTDWLMVTGVNSTIISGKLKIASASATGGALVRVNCRAQV